MPGIVITTNGWIYGLSPDGLFKIQTSGQSLEYLPATVTGAWRSGIFRASDGNYYGAGVNVFRIAPDLTSVQVLRQFAQDGSEGVATGLIEGSDGFLHGVAADGKEYSGRVFKLAKDGSGYTSSHFMTGWGSYWSRRSTHKFTSDSAIPRGNLTEGSDGSLYAITQFGGNYGGGTFLRIGKSGTGYEIIYHFSGSSNDGAAPEDGLIEGSDGRLYGTTPNGGGHNSGIVFAINKDGSEFKILKRFSTSGINGGSPLGDLITGSDGNIYGTTARGGSNGFGTVYRLNWDGTGHTVIKSFSFTKSDGGVPLAGVIEGLDGNLYGTTSLGGSNRVGTIYKISKDGSRYKVLHHFTGATNDGGRPAVRLTKGSDGYLYGVTRKGGDGYGEGYGIIFRITENGNFTLIEHLGGDSNFTSELCEGPDGFLYGTEPWHMVSGSLFRVSKAGGDYTNILTFPLGENQYYVSSPWEGVSIGTNNQLYGAASGVFKFDPASMQAASFPITLQSMTLDNDGSIFGISDHWWNRRTIFIKADQAGVVHQEIHAIDWDVSWFNPLSQLLIGKDQMLFSTLPYSGPEHAGSVVRLSAGPFPTLRLLRAERSAEVTKIAFSGQAGQTFRVQASDNLERPIWHLIAAAVIGDNGAAEVVDVQSTNYMARFYRAVQP